MKTTPETTPAAGAEPLSLDAAALRLRVDRRTLAKAIDADRFAVPVDHKGHKASPRYALAVACEALAAHRWRSEPRIPDPEPVAALARLSENLAAVAARMEEHGGTFSQAAAALWPRPEPPPCPLCGAVHADADHPPKYLR
jgi:hypothetical protein